MVLTTPTWPCTCTHQATHWLQQVGFCETFWHTLRPVQACTDSQLHLAGQECAACLSSCVPITRKGTLASALPLPRQTTELSCPADAGDAAEALAALQGSSRGMAPPQAPGAPSLPAQIMPGLRVPGMGRGSSLYRGVSKVNLLLSSRRCL